MKTYKDIYEAVKKGATITLTNHYGNTITYFKNEEGKIRQRFNDCIDTHFSGLNTPIGHCSIDIKNS